MEEEEEVDSVSLRQRRGKSELWKYRDSKEQREKDAEGEGVISQKRCRGYWCCSICEKERLFNGFSLEEVSAL